MEEVDNGEYEIKRNRNLEEGSSLVEVTGTSPVPN
jgi:hypothetical protein